MGNLGAIFILMVLGLLGAILVSGVTRDDMGHYLKTAFSREVVEDEMSWMRPVSQFVSILVETLTPQPQQLTLVPEESRSRNKSQPKP